MEKNVLKVRMLGTFSMEYKGKELVLDRNKASKTTQLFQLLMFHTEDGGISKRKKKRRNGKRTSSISGCRPGKFIKVNFSRI